MYCTVSCNLYHIHVYKLTTFISVSYHLIPSFTYQTKNVMVSLTDYELIRLMLHCLSYSTSFLVATHDVH